MHSYIIQYPSMYPNGGSSQRQIIANNNLVKSVLIDDEGCEKNKKQDKKVFVGKVVSLRLVSHPKEKIQRMCKQELVEQQAEVVPARSTTMKKVWKPKQVVSSLA